MTSIIGQLTEGIVSSLADNAVVWSMVGETDLIPWILQDSPQGLIEGSETGALTVRPAGSWRSSADQSGLAFPRMVLGVWVDSTRDATGTADESFSETRDRAQELFEAADAVIFPTGTGDIVYDTFKVGYVQRLNEPSFRQVADGTGLVVGEATYAFEV